MKELYEALEKIRNHCCETYCGMCVFTVGKRCGVIELTEELQDCPADWDMDAIKSVLEHE